MVHLEKISGGGWRVSRVMPCGASMQAAATALEGVNPLAFAAIQPAHDPVRNYPAAGANYRAVSVNSAPTDGNGAIRERAWADDDEPPLRACVSQADEE